MRSRKNLEESVLALLRSADLNGREYSLDDFIGKMRQIFPGVMFESFTPVGNLRAGLFQVGPTVVIFYPSPKATSLFAALYALSHEIAHLHLRHRLFPPGAESTHDQVEEDEAEQVARMIVRLRVLAANSETTGSTAMTRYFTDVGR